MGNSHLLNIIFKNDKIINLAISNLKPTLLMPNDTLDLTLHLNSVDAMISHWMGPYGFDISFRNALR